MINLQELFQQLDLRPSSEAARSLEVGLHLSSIQASPDIARREMGWHIDRVMAFVASARAEAFFDEFGRFCGKLVLATLDDADEQRFLEGELPGAEVLMKPLGREAWIIEGGFWYGALRKGRRILKQVLSARGIETLGYVVHRESAPPVAKILALDWLRDAVPPMRASTSPLSSAQMGQLRHEAQSWLAERQTIGAAIRVLSSARSFRTLSLDEAMCLLLGSINVGQYEIRCTEAGKPVSFRSWAYLTEHAVARLTSHGPKSLSDGCWNQGLQKTLVCDWSTPSRSEEQDEAGGRARRSDWAWAVLPDSRYAIYDSSQHVNIERT